MIDRSADVYALDQQGGKSGANYMVNTMCTILSDSHGTPHAIAYKNVINSSGGVSQAHLTPITGRDAESGREPKENS